MMVRKSALALLLLIVLLFAAAFWTLRNGFVESLLETSLEKKFQAKVELEQLELAPFSLQASFASLAIADKDRPRRNLVQTGAAALDVAFLPLLSSRLAIETITLEEIVLGSERKTSGALTPIEQAGVADDAGKPETAEEKTDPKSSLEKLTGQLPKLKLDRLTKSLNIDAMVDPETLRSVDTIREEKNKLIERVGSVDKRLEQQTLVADSKALKQKIKQLKVDNVKDARQLKDALGQLKKLRDEGRALQQQARQLRDETEQDLQSIKFSVTDINQLVTQDIADVRRLADIGTLNVAEIGKMIFGQAALDQFARFLAYYQQAKSFMQDESDRKPEPDSRLGGRDIHFPVNQPSRPRFLVQEALFTGAVEGDPFSGKLLGLNSNPAKYGKPTRLDMDYRQADNQWRVQGELASAGRDWLSMRGVDLRLQPVKLKLGPASGLPNRMIADKSNIEIQFGVAGEALSGKMQVLARQPRFEFIQPPDGGVSRVQREIQALFSGFQELDLSVELAGTLSSPQLKISSSLDEKISRGLKNLFGEKVKQAEKKIREAVNQAAERELQQSERLLDDKVAGAGKQLRAIIKEPETLQALLDSKQEQLEGQLKQQADELKDKASDQLKDKFKQQLKQLNF